MTQSFPKLYDLRESSAVTQLSAERLRELINEGKLTYHQPGGPKGKLYLPESELERLMTPIRKAQ